MPAPLLLGARAPALVVGGTAWHVVAADVDPAWVAAQVAHDPIAAPLGARFLPPSPTASAPSRACSTPCWSAPPRRRSPPWTWSPADRRGPPAGASGRCRTAPTSGSGRRPTAPALLTLGRGVCGRWEVSLEVEAAARGRGLGTALAAAAPALVPAGTAVGAGGAGQRGVPPVFLAAGYRAVAAEVLFGS